MTINLNAGHPSFHANTIKRALADSGRTPLSRNWRVFYSEDNLSGLMLFSSCWGWAEKDGVPIPIVIDLKDRAVRQHETKNKDALEVIAELGRESVAPP